jgi:hypothetical protein
MMRRKEHVKLKYNGARALLSGTALPEPAAGTIHMACRAQLPDASCVLISLEDTRAIAGQTQPSKAKADGDFKVVWRLQR